MRNLIPLAALVAAVAAGATGCSGGGGSPGVAGGSKISRPFGGGGSGGAAPGGSTIGGPAAAGAPATGGAGLYYSENFDGPSPKIVLQAGAFVSPWVLGPPANLAAGAHSGPNCLAVATSTYLPGLRATCMTTPIDLSHATAPILVFFHAYDAEANYDGGRVQVLSPTLIYQTIEPFRAYSRPVVYMTGDAAFCGQSLPPGASAPQWVEERFDLSDPAFRTAGVQIVFDFLADAGSVGGTGWFIDDVQVGEPSAVGPLTPLQHAIFQENFDGPSPQFRTIPATGSNWEIGAPLTNVGPKAAASPPRCAATNMAAPAPNPPFAGRYPDGVGLAYPTSQPDRLVTSVAVTPSGPEAALVFEHFYDFEGLNAFGPTGSFGPSFYDGGRVVASKDPASGVWIVLEPRDGYTGQVAGFLNNTENAAQDAWCGLTNGWHRAFVDLAPAIQQLGPSFFIGFEFASDASNARAFAGWYVDDVAVLER